MAVIGVQTWKNHRDMSPSATDAHFVKECLKARALGDGIQAYSMELYEEYGDKLLRVRGQYCGWDGFEKYNMTSQVRSLLLRPEDTYLHMWREAGGMGQRTAYHCF